MSAGLSQKQIYHRVYSRLQGIRRELQRAGVPVAYGNRTLFYNGEDAHVGFEIGFRVLQASNGEVAGLPFVSISQPANRETFDHLQFRRGVERVKELFGRKN